MVIRPPSPNEKSLAMTESTMAAVSADLSTTLDMNVSRLRDALAAVLPAASKDSARPILTGVLIEPEGTGHVRLVATDSYRLVSVPVPVPVELAEPVLVSGSSMRQVLAALKPAAAGGRNPVAPATFRFDLSESGETWKGSFDNGHGVTAALDTVDGEYPSWRGLVPWDLVGREGGDSPSGLMAGLNAGYLADMAKAMGKLATDKCPVTIRVQAPEMKDAPAYDQHSGPRQVLKPVLFGVRDADRFPADGPQPVGILMPVRVAK